VKDPLQLLDTICLNLLSHHSRLNTGFAGATLSLVPSILLPFTYFSLDLEHFPMIADLIL